MTLRVEEARYLSPRAPLPIARTRVVEVD